MLRLVAMRRIQAATLIVALLAVPLALVARAYAGASEECTMACCRGRHATAMKMNMCKHASKGAAPCTMGCDSQPAPDYGLASPLGPFQLAAVAQLPTRGMARDNFVTARVFDSAGYFPPPFNPPRA